MSHTLSFARSIALASLWIFFGTAAVAKAQETSTTTPKSASDPKAAAPGQAKPGSGKSSSAKSKDDTGVDLDAKLKAKKKEERKPNFEIRSVRTSPSDVITYFKKNHWTLFHLDLIANNSDETIEIRTGYEPVSDSPHQVRYRRLVHLIKEQNRLYRLPVLLSHARTGKMVELALYTHPDGVLPITPPGIDNQPCTLLETDQFLVLVLSVDPDNYNFLKPMQCFLPGSEEDNEPSDRRRYYHVVTPFQPTRPLVADTALAWTTTSYVIWDDLDPGYLSARQQEALVDWLHMGGQLIVSGGASATKLAQSFLAPYLPADVVGSGQLTDLGVLSNKYHTATSIQHPQRQVKKINILPEKPVYVAKLQPRPEAPRVQDEVEDLPLWVERPIGRGRVVMAAFSLYQPELVNWREGYDSFWREVLLKVPETKPNPEYQPGKDVKTYTRLPAHALSKVRIMARDLGAGSRRTKTVVEKPVDEQDIPGVDYVGNQEAERTTDTVAEWRDETPVPAAARQSLLDATGIKIPPPDFVLAAAVSYLIVLVPLNWLVCRFGLRRPELAWLAAPVIIVGFSIGIVEFARVNVGFDITSHEIDVVETYADYPRAHLSRFTCLYSGSRQRCEFRFEDASALAMPMATGTQRGQNIERISLDVDMPHGVPVVLGRYEVHPRSIGMVRAEQMVSLSGPFQLQPASGAGKWVIDNRSGWELWDCHLVTPTGKIRLGDLPVGGGLEFSPGTTAGAAPLGESSAPSQGHRIALEDHPMVRRWRDEFADRIDQMPVRESDIAGHTTLRELGELLPARVTSLLESRPEWGTRLVGWAPRPTPGQEIDPKPDRTIGFTVFVVHLEKP